METRHILIQYIYFYSQTNTVISNHDVSKSFPVLKFLYVVDLFSSNKALKHNVQLMQKLVFWILRDISFSLFPQNVVLSFYLLKFLFFYFFNVQYVRKYLSYFHIYYCFFSLQSARIKSWNNSRWDELWSHGPSDKLLLCLGNWNTRHWATTI